MRLRIQNFKSYSDTGFLDLKPLTLIFGKNSAGKSAVIQALNALGASPFAGNQMGKRFNSINEADLGLRFYGETWDLGDFDRTVHNRNKAANIGFELQFSFFGERQRSWPPEIRDKRDALETSDSFDSALQLSVALGFGSPGDLNSLKITSSKEIPSSFYIRGTRTSSSSYERAFIRGFELEQLIPFILKNRRHTVVTEELFKVIKHMWRKARIDRPDGLLEQMSELEHQRAKVNALSNELEQFKSKRQQRDLSDAYDGNSFKLVQKLETESDPVKRKQLKALFKKYEEADVQARKYVRLVDDLESEEKKLKKLLSRTRQRPKESELMALVGLDWLRQYGSPESFMRDGSDAEFSAALHNLAPVDPAIRRRLELALGSFLRENWVLPKLSVILKECPEDVAKKLNRQITRNLKKRYEKNYSFGPKLFSIDHEFIVQSFRSLPIEEISAVLCEKIEHIRFFAALDPVLIFGADVSGSNPELVTEYPLTETGLSFSDEPLSAVGFLAPIISQALVRLSVELEGITHIPAFRGLPRRTWDRDSKDEIAKSLDRLSTTQIKKLNAAMALIGWKQEFKVGIDSESGESRKIPKLSSAYADSNKKQFETLVDVGFGFSQLLPILENAISKEPKSFLVEEPEVHLHPSLQGDLIELMARNSGACTDIPMSKIPANSPIGNDHNWFIETHSEYMLRRVQKLVSKGVLDHKAIAIYFCDIDEEDERVIWQINLGSRGQMLDPWPNDFIETALDLHGPEITSSGTE